MKTTDDIVIRHAVPDDAAALIEYLNTIGGESDNLTFGKDEFPIKPEQERAFIEGLAEKPHDCMIVAVKDGRIVGDATLAGHPRRMAHRAELGISVLKAEWGRGIGSRLMEALIEYAEQHGVELLNLEARADNEKAIHLYEKFGFRTIGVSPAFMKLRGEYHDAVLMYLDLRAAAEE